VVCISHSCSPPSLAPPERRISAARPFGIGEEVRSETHSLEWFRNTGGAYRYTSERRAKRAHTLSCDPRSVCSSLACFVPENSDSEKTGRGKDGLPSTPLCGGRVATRLYARRTVPLRQARRSRREGSASKPLHQSETVSNVRVAEAHIRAGRPREERGLSARCLDHRVARTVLLPRDWSDALFQIIRSLKRLSD